MVKTLGKADFGEKRDTDNSSATEHPFLPIPPEILLEQKIGHSSGKHGRKLYEVGINRDYIDGPSESSPTPSTSRPVEFSTHRSTEPEIIFTSFGNRNTKGENFINRLEIESSTTNQSESTSSTNNLIIGLATFLGLLLLLVLVLACVLGRKFIRRGAVVAAPADGSTRSPSWVEQPARTTPQQPVSELTIKSNRTAPIPRAQPSPPLEQPKEVSEMAVNYWLANLNGNHYAPASHVSIGAQSIPVHPTPPSSSDRFYYSVSDRASSDIYKPLANDNFLQLQRKFYAQNGVIPENEVKRDFDESSQYSSAVSDIITDRPLGNTRMGMAIEADRIKKVRRKPSRKRSMRQAERVVANL